MIEFSTCIHEAGHTLALYLLGGTIKSVEVNSPWYDSANFCKHPGIFKDSIAINHPSAKAAITILLAGPAAEFRHGTIDIRCAMHDIKLSRGCLKVKGWQDTGQDDSAFFTEFSDDAQRFVEHPIRWKMIEALAQELKKRRQMSGQEAVRWINQTAEKLPVKEFMELMYPVDGLGGDHLSIENHGG